MVVNTQFWEGKKVFITGHTGFKGAWLSLWLQSMGAMVTGYSLPPAAGPGIFSQSEIERSMRHITGDIRDSEKLRSAFYEAEPDIVFHLAAQSLVRRSYQNPAETYSTNVMGTVNLFESIAGMSSAKAVINVTSDKCYENMEWSRGYNESDRLGGHDPYSTSKACSELVTQAYRNLFAARNHNAKLASVRAGNVIGGGDWADDRLIPDLMRAYINRRPLCLRYPHAVRPWQHVLEPLAGYLLLAERIYSGRVDYADAWNFGPDDVQVCSVGSVVRQIQTLLGEKIDTDTDVGSQPHEALILKLDCSRARSKLQWKPRWGLEESLKKTTDWYMAYQNGQNMRHFSLSQIDSYVGCSL